MENQELDILILSYINNEMTAEEKTAFETRMSNNENLKQTVEEYTTIKRGINKFAKQDLKAEIIAIELTTLKTNSLSNYKPSINGGGGFSFGKFLFKSILSISLIVIGLIYFDKLPIKHPVIETLNKNMHNIKVEKQIEIDTVWHIIKTNKVSKGDTILIRNQKELEEWESKNGM